jgi:hypothetical protein
MGATIFSPGAFKDPGTRCRYLGLVRQESSAGRNGGAYCQDVDVAPPERINAIVSQNGNAYEEGLGNAWAPFGATGTSLLLRTAKQSAKS